MNNHSWLLVHLLALYTISVSSKVFVSIDCGASSSYTDENSIVWKGDSDLISNGVTQTVQSNNSVSRIMDTLRVFSNGISKKNCYSVEVQVGEKVLVRAGFNYGNYDQKSTPPIFDLLFDGNFWITVNASQVKIYEAIYVVKRETVSICVAQTKPDQFPFISTLEVRSLDSQLYSKIGDNYALLMNLRLAYAVNETVRFPSDPYDRIWVPAFTTGLVNIVNEASVINVDNAPDNPPQAVLKNAVATANTSQMITLGLGQIDYPTRYPVYINWYFTEVKELNSTETRSFRVLKDNLPFSLPIVPRFQSAIQYFISNLTVNLDTNFSLNPLGDSTLPALISAVELFSISDPLTDGTNKSDVEGLASLQNMFRVLRQWGGDPCLPAAYSWEWIKCSNDSTPRVTSINLSSFNLSGPLPDFSNMDALEIIDFHNNSLTGSIPNFLGTLPSLKQLNLAENQFSGSIPLSLSRNSELDLSDAGNPLLCGANGKSCPAGNVKNKTSKLALILGITLPVFFIIGAIVAVMVIRHNRHKANILSHSGNVSQRGNDPSSSNRGTNKGAVELNGNIDERFYRSPTPLLGDGTS